MKLLKNKTIKEIYFSWKWRLWVDEAWLYSLSLSIISIIVWILWSLAVRTIRWWYNDLWNYTTLQESLRCFFDISQVLIRILLFVMDIYVWIKRAHDLWRKWTRLRCLLIPIYNIIVWIQLAFYTWKKEDNEYWKYDEKKLPVIAYIILTIEFVAILWWNYFWDKVTSLYEDKPLNKFNERVYQNDKLTDLLIWNDDFDAESRKMTKEIVDKKLNCDCFWEDATQKPTIELDENFWNSVYEELEPKLLELAEDPNYNTEEEWQTKLAPSFYCEQNSWVVETMKSGLEEVTICTFEDKSYCKLEDFADKKCNKGDNHFITDWNEN